MKVLPSQSGAVAAPQLANARPAGGAAFESELAKASTETPEVKPREGESLKQVEGRGFADIVGGKRSGMYVNTSGNERHGQAFVLVRKHGREYHVYGSGNDRLVVSVKPPADRNPEGEKVEPVPGRPYAEITSGPRSGMFINTGDNDRHGDAFVLVNRGGVEYHIYGSGKDREVVPVRRRSDT